MVRYIFRMSNQKHEPKSSSKLSTRASGEKEMSAYLLDGTALDAELGARQYGSSETNLLR